MKQIAEQINVEGFRPPKRSQTFSAQSVNDLLRRQGLLRYPGRSGHPPDEHLGEHEWRLPDLAAALDMPHATLHTWAQRPNGYYTRHRFLNNQNTTREEENDGHDNRRTI